MDQKPRPHTFVVPQSPVISQVSPTNTSPATSNYVLTSSNFRPVTNYTIIASSPASTTHSYITQSGIRTTHPQFVNVQSTSNVRHILSSNSQPSNITYMLPSGAHIVRMSSIVTPTVTGEQHSGPQFILTSSAQKISPNTTNSSQSSKTNNAVTDNNALVGELLTKTIGVSSNTPPTFQKSGMSLPRLSAAYYNQVKGSESPRISFRSINEQQKSGTSFILASSDWSRTKNVPVSNLSKIGNNYMQIPLIQKSGTMLSTNVSRPSTDVRAGQHQRSQNQTIRSVILPSNYRTAMSPQRNTDCRLVLNSINVPSQVLTSTDGKPRMGNVPVTNIQKFGTNYVQIPITQKSGTILSRGNQHPSTDSNVRVGQQQHQIRSLILPPNYRATMVSPRRGLDYRLILKPVNIQPQVLKTLPSPRQNSSRQTPPPVSQSNSNRVALLRSTNNKNHNETEVLATSKIVPIPLKGRKSHLVISDRTIKMVVDELNQKNITDNESILKLTPASMEIVQAEVSYRLFYLLRECKKVLVKSHMNVLTEEIVRQVCADYFTPFYGNKLWPLFCLKPNEDEIESNNLENRVWIRKHNNVNVVGWLKHPKFRNPSYIKKRPKIKLKIKEFVPDTVEQVLNVQQDFLSNTTITRVNDKSTIKSMTISQMDLSDKQISREISLINHTSSSQISLDMLSKQAAAQTCTVKPIENTNINPTTILNTPITVSTIKSSQSHGSTNNSLINNKPSKVPYIILD
ncbi:uncharacterized protein LOC126899395 [Daktulosphaira vitifoliae]|uniref:uncharacterized protein LOC126899395 n=1 Tax=Daktulosphaira vitifoliae TaxID=58002 RepID=UPI0021AAAF1C|nr:uncharacterized protein LOC126899395 [Daktulosphaira vitifoliae]